MKEECPWNETNEREVKRTLFLLSCILSLSLFFCNAALCFLFLKNSFPRSILSLFPLFSLSSSLSLSLFSPKHPFRKRKSQSKSKSKAKTKKKKKKGEKNFSFRFLQRELYFLIPLLEVCSSLDTFDRFPQATSEPSESNRRRERKERATVRGGRSSCCPRVPMLPHFGLSLSLPTPSLWPESISFLHRSLESGLPLIMG